MQDGTVDRVADRTLENGVYVRSSAGAIIGLAPVYTIINRVYKSFGTDQCLFNWRNAGPRGLEHGNRGLCRIISDLKDPKLGGD
jgi:hypothetical protein